MKIFLNNTDKNHFRIKCNGNIIRSRNKLKMAYLKIAKFHACFTAASTFRVGLRLVLYKHMWGGHTYYPLKYETLNRDQ